MMSFTPPYLYGTNSLSMLLPNAQSVFTAPPTQHDQQQQHPLAAFQYYVQPSYIIAATPSGNYLIPSSTPQQQPQQQQQQTNGTAAAAHAVPYLLDINALSGAGSAVPATTGFSPTAAPVMTMFGTPVGGSAIVVPSHTAAPFYATPGPTTRGLTVSTPLSAKKGAKYGVSGKTQSPKAVAKPPTPAPVATLPMAKTFAEEPVEIDVTKRQLIVNYLPQKLSNEEFKALFRPFGKLDEERSHIVFDFRTAGGVNAELFAWYWKRGSNGAVASEDPANPVAEGEDSGASTPEERQRDRVFSELMKTIDFAKVERQMRSKGYGFIYYQDGASTEQALKQLNGFEVNGRRIKVRYAEQQRSAAEAAAGANNVSPADTKEDVESNVSSHVFTTTAAVAGNASYTSTLTGDRSVSPVPPLTMGQLLLEGAEAAHIATTPMLKIRESSVGFELGAMQSEQSIISSVYDLLEVDAE